MTPLPAAVGLFRGPGHVVEYVNDELRRWAPAFVDPTGMPAFEAFIIPNEGARRGMDECYRTGRRVEVDGFLGGFLTIKARRDPAGRIVGVATHWAPEQVRIRALARPVGGPPPLQPLRQRSRHPLGRVGARDPRGAPHP